MAQGSDAVERHQATATRLRGEIQQLVKQAQVLLHGEPDARRPSAPRQPNPRRTEREQELEQALEKADWFRREIKRMRQELDSRDHLSAGPADPRERDPMRLYNLLVDKRRELEEVQHCSLGLERSAKAQRKAEAAQSALRPEVESRLLR
ncbi:unnamed protein product, partial [Polarella glacialis]